MSMSRKIYTKKPKNAGEIITNGLGTTIKDTTRLFRGMRGILVIKKSQRHFLDVSRKKPAMFGRLFKRKR